MPTNNFKPFSTASNANVISQTDYEALPALAGGFTAGKAASAQINKAIRQGTVISSVLAQFIANLSGNDVLDNGDTTTILNNLALALTANGSNTFLQTLNNLLEIKNAGSVAQGAARTNIGAAALAGLATQLFSVATATDNNHAVNLSQLNNLITSLALGTASKKNVGIGAGQIPDMSNFTAGNNSTAFWNQFPNGMVMMAGNAPGITGGGSGNSVFFPVPFPNTCSSVIVTLVTNGLFPQTVSFNVFIPDKTKFNVYTNTSGTYTIFYQAFGS